MLVLADADGFGIDLDEFGERVLEAAGDGDGAAHGEVEIGKLLTGDVGGGVDAGAGFVDHDGEDVVELAFAKEVADEGVGLARGGAVADGDGADVVLGDQRGEGVACSGGCVLGSVGVDDVVARNLPVSSTTAILQPVRRPGSMPRTEIGPAGGASRRFWRLSRKTWMASGSERFLSSRRSSPWMEGLRRRFQESSMASSRCGVQSPVCAEDAGADERGGAERIELDEEVEDGLGFAAANGEHAVRGDGLYRLAIVVVHLELFLLVDRVEGFLADDDAFLEQELAESLAEVGVLADGFGDDMAGAFEGILDGGDFLFGADKGGREFGEGLRCWELRPEVVGERLQAAVAGDGGLGASLGAIGEVEVFELGLVEGGVDTRLKVIGELALLEDGGEDGLAAADEIAEVGDFSSMSRIWTSSRLPVASLR